MAVVFRQGPSYTSGQPLLDANSGVGKAVVGTLATLVVAPFALIALLVVLVAGAAVYSSAAIAYAGILEVPTTFGVAQWNGFWMSVATGALIGIVTGLVRFLRARPAITFALEKILEPEFIKSAQVGAACMFFHVSLGAFAGGVVGLLGLVSPGSLLAGGAEVFATDPQPLVLQLLEQGFFNGGGAPSGGGPLLSFLLLFVLLLLVLIIVAVVWSGMWCAVATAAVSGAGLGVGTAFGTSVLAWFGYKRLGYSGMSGKQDLLRGAWLSLWGSSAASGAWTAALQTAIVIACLFALRSVAEASWTAPTLGEITDRPTSYQTPLAGAGRTVRYESSRVTVHNADGALLVEMPVQGYLFDVDWAPAPDRLVVATTSGLTVFDTRTGDRVCLITPHISPERRIASICFDGQYVAAASGDLIEIWSASDGTLLRELPAQSSYVSAVQFMPTGHSFAAACHGLYEAGAAIRIWDADTGRCSSQVPCDFKPSQLWFSSDGRTLTARDEKQEAHFSINLP